MTLRRLGCLKPEASVTTHLLVAALLWSLIGAYLAVRGVLLREGSSFWLLAGAAAAGVGKSGLVLDRTARKNISRIVAKEERSCLGGVYSWRMWGFIVLMMLLGRFLRASGLAGWIVGLVYVGVGTALCWSSRLFWRRWLAARPS
ncbi:MAG: hypothetical protein AB1413_03975 [Thermodesulfobacteriota bacterium]